ncbi:thermonuclease family protein [Rhizobium sp. RU36D]|uniref:thermonuclease family protein n=1 Tax=Rhizobium sp. RU36D TaxID=1907415 RepID=UPI0009D7FF49|nr:thermonuclease family protein [Rhizobium sp. RU36D]SMC80477.1 Endonuclease YncB, thermonuclease family [Rhizobium sp. RU36D]
MAILRKIRDAIVLVCMLVLGLLILAKLEQQQGSTYSGPFWAVDGDTVSDAGERLRLAGIDAPELAQTCEHNNRPWPCGRVARDRLQALVTAREVRCEGFSQDKYHRVLVTCRNGEEDLAALLVREGLAVSYGRHQSEEAAARAAGRGLWAGPFMRPQDYRRQQGLAEEDIGDAWLSRLVDWLFCLM